MFVCEMNYKSYEACKKRYEVTGGGGILNKEGKGSHLLFTEILILLKYPPPSSPFLYVTNDRSLKH